VSIQRRRIQANRLGQMGARHMRTVHTRDNLRQYGNHGAYSNDKYQTRSLQQGKHA
jgi:hypothetical protein